MGKRTPKTVKPLDPRDYPKRSQCLHCRDDLGPVKYVYKDSLLVNVVIRTECDACRQELSDGTIPAGMTDSRASRSPGPRDDFDESLAADMEDACD